MPWTYEKDPAAIYRQSFAAIRAEADLARLPPPLVPVAARLAHACGDVGVIDALAWSDDAVAAARRALAGGAAVLVDTEMVAHGVIRRFLAGSAVVCALNAPGVAERAKALGTTRSAAALDLWEDRLAGAVVAIGNAPTALFRLLEGIEAGGPRPACVLGFPVGFIGAAESKDALITAGRTWDLPFIALRGRRGGSALAAAAVNALAAPEESR
jgi:precorrin-8X/cobalt-precorrin-8 methylmutase